MANYSIQEIARILKAEVIPDISRDIRIRELLTDSRSLTSPPTSLFFALIGKRNNGHIYIGDLYLKGVRAFVVSFLPEDISGFPEAHFIKVEDTLSALQNLASYHRKQFSYPVIGITGSNGKTIVKEWLYQLLSTDRKIIRSPKSYNSQVGVPLSIWQMSEDHDLAIIEAGISEPDEMERLQPVIQPTIGIFTNIGTAHEKNFIHAFQKVGEKLKLFTRVGTLIYCPDYFEIQDRIIRSELLKSIKQFSWSRKPGVQMFISSVEKKQKTSIICARVKSDDITIEIPFTDDASVENAINCWALMLVLGYTNEVIAGRMMQLSPVAMRLEMKEGINNSSIINDSYNSDINSLSIALDFLNQQKQHERKTVILSDILQSSLSDDELYSEVARLLREKKISKLIGIGPAISRQSEKFGCDRSFYISTNEFIDKISLTAFQNESVLLKGARVFEFERIGRLLQQKLHDTVLEINLNALVNNLNYYRSKLSPGVKIMAMVKAFSYGSGSFEVANTLQYNNIDYLTVAYVDEGIELRKAGITVPIMVMSPEEQSLDILLKFRLEPEIFSFRVLDLLKETIRTQMANSDKKVEIHIKIDTGMHRLGFDSAEVKKLCDSLAEEPRIVVRSVFSHLATAEDSRYDDFTLQQIAKFRESGNAIKDFLGLPILMHILNSPGISRFPEAQLDMVRLGIGLYGVGVDEKEQQMLQYVSSMRSVISQMREIPEGSSVGYGMSWVARRPTRIAVVPIGYADGLNRKLGNGAGRLVVKGITVPIIGNICMDMCMIDVTGIDVKEGDDVIVFDGQHTIKELAKSLDTIPYEILTSVSRRVKRIYYYE